jgi:hypothetical protein
MGYGEEEKKKKRRRKKKLNKKGRLYKAQISTM